MLSIEAASMSPRIGRLQGLLGVSIMLLFPGLIVRLRGQIPCPAPGG